MYIRISAIILMAFMSSCLVSKKKFDDLNVEKSSLEVEKADAAKALRVEKAKNKDLSSENEAQNSKLTKLTNDKAKVLEDLKGLKEQYQVLSQVSNADAKKLNLEMQKAKNLQESLEQKNLVLETKTRELEEQFEKAGFQTVHCWHPKGDMAAFIIAKKV